METPSINKSMQDIGNQVRGSIPSIKVGTPDKSPFNPNTNQKKDDWVEKLRSLGIILAVILVVGYAVYRLFFG